MNFPLPSSPLLFTRSLHPLTQTLTYANFSFPVQNDINCQAIVKICVSVCLCVKEGKITQVIKGISVHDVTQSSISLSPSLVQGGRINMTHKMYKGEMRTFTICSLASYLCFCSLSLYQAHSLYLLYITLSPWA